MTSDDKLNVLRARLALYRTLIHIRGDVQISVSDERPNGRHLHAWTIPADAFLQGPAGTIGIVFYRQSLERQDLHVLAGILAHEVGHAAIDMEAIRNGQWHDETAADAIQRCLMVVFK